MMGKFDEFCQILCVDKIGFLRPGHIIMSDITGRHTAEPSDML